MSIPQLEEGSEELYLQVGTPMEEGEDCSQQEERPVRGNCMQLGLVRY